jgi:hypothetical protein
MSSMWTSLALCIILASASTAHSYRVLTVITPGPQSHAFGMKRITEEMQSRGLDVTVCTHPRCPPRRRKQPPCMHACMHAHQQPLLPCAVPGD